MGCLISLYKAHCFFSLVTQHSIWLYRNLSSSHRRISAMLPMTVKTVL